MSNAISVSNELQKHIDFIILELRTTSGARAIAAAAGIEEGIEGDVDDADSLWEHGKDLIGMEALHEGYDHDYSMDDDEEPILGYGISTSSHEAYLALHEHFGAQWLEKTLMVGAATIDEAKVLHEKALEAFKIACALQRAERVVEISGQMTELAREVQRLVA